MRAGIAPGSNLLEAIFKKCAPCLILIDEWVAYLRQIYKVDGLPSGSFDANLSFVQSLTEAVKASPGTLLVASLPASQIEVGGEGGQEALARLKQTFSRVEIVVASGVAGRELRDRPASAVQGNPRRQVPSPGQHAEAVRQALPRERERLPARLRRRGLSPQAGEGLPDPSGAVRPALYELGIAGEIPAHARRAAPDGAGHPRALDGQRPVGDDHAGQRRDQLGARRAGTAALSRRKLAVDHRRRCRWHEFDALQDRPVRAEPEPLFGNAPRRARDLHGDGADPQARRTRGSTTSRSILASSSRARRPAIFGDALRRLTNQAKFMHSDLGRYWYSMSASLNRIAADRAGQLEEALVLMEIDKALTATSTA